LFDILNSRNPCAKGFKAALRKSNKETWEAFFEEAYAYIMALRDTNGNLMYSTRKKTGFIGFLVAIVGMKHTFFDLVEKKDAPMKYVLTYKFSQDHLELFLELFDPLENLITILLPSNSRQPTRDRF
jgi:hypothetical protein